eukprot:6195606-Pleurochrysis_carterae.AAC.4
MAMPLIHCAFGKDTQGCCVARRGAAVRALSRSQCRRSAERITRRELRAASEQSRTCAGRV